MNLIQFFRLLVLTFSFGWHLTAWSADSNIDDTLLTYHEIQFCSGMQAPYTSCAASDLRTKADALGSAPAIYEYVRNNYGFALYNGARSGSINTFLGGRGNDVDQAAVLISMLRSQGMPARFVVGTVKLPAAQVMNWFGVENVDLAYGLLWDIYTPNISMATDKSTLSFEHVWVEALVPYAKYRGAGPTTINCTVTPTSCNWVPLDPSFKQHKQRTSGLDPFSALTFDYDTYYKTIKNSDSTRLNKNPLEIYQEQVLAWLQTTAPGKTLEDVPDFTTIVKEEAGLLPASLPFVTVGNLRRFNSIRDHDDAVPSSETTKWMKYVTAQAKIDSNVIGTATVSLLDATTNSFVLSFAKDAGGNLRPVFKLGGVPVDSTVNPTVTMGAAFTIDVSMDGIWPQAATYKEVVGGYFLIVSGGDSDNWSQVHRAAQQLLNMNQQYKIVFNPSDKDAGGKFCSDTTSSQINCTPYVDSGTMGWDAGDTKLLDNSAALDALTGGLLDVTGRLYLAEFGDAISKADALNKVKTLRSGFLGVISSTHDVEYIDGTVYSVTPGGLLIDLKNLGFSSWRIGESGGSTEKQRLFLGHITSSLEHEVWQQITGFDAISTVRGFQTALGNGAMMLNPASFDEMNSLLPSFGYSTSVPSGFTRNVRNIFGKDYLSWSYNGSDPNAGFAVLHQDVYALWEGDPLNSFQTVFASTGMDAYLSAIDSQENGLITAQATEGLLKTNVEYSLSWSNSTYHVLGATVASSGFSLASFELVDAATKTYKFRFNETTGHNDGKYSINMNLDYGDDTHETSSLLPVTPPSPLLTSYAVVTAPTTSTPGFHVKTYTAYLGQLYVTLEEATPHQPDGTYNVAVTGSIKWWLPGLGYSTPVAWSGTMTVTIKNGHWVDYASYPTTFTNVDFSDSPDITCGGTTYSGTPTVLLGNLQTCFNSAISSWNSHFAFLDPAAPLWFRSLPIAYEALPSSVIADLRYGLKYTKYLFGSEEYLIPSQLSIGPNYRFAVWLKKDTTGSGETEQYYSIQNQTGLSAE